MTSTATPRPIAPAARPTRAGRRRGAVSVLLALALTALLGAGGTSASNAPVTVAGGPGNCC